MTRYAYRLRSWPELPERFRTAPVLRALSRMTLGPVTHTWFLERTGLASEEAHGLLAQLLAGECIERIDFAAAPERPQ